MLFYKHLFNNSRKIISSWVLTVFSLTALAQSQRPVLTLPIGHQQPVHTIDFSKDGKLIVTGGLDNTFILWDAKTGFIIRRTVIQGPVQQILFTPDGSQLLTLIGQSNAKFYSKKKLVIQRWDIKTGKALTPLPFSGSPGMQFLPISGYLLVPDYSTDLSEKKESYANLFDMTNPDKMADNIQKMMAEKYKIDTAVDEDSEQAKDNRNSMKQVDFTDRKQVEEWQKKRMQQILGDDPTAKMFERNVTLVDFKTLKAIATIDKEPKIMNVLQFNNNEYIITEHEVAFEKNSKKLVAWEVNEFINHYKEKRKIKAFKEFKTADRLHFLATSLSKGFVAVDDDKNTVQLWQMGKPNPAALFKTRGNNLDNIEFSPGGDTVYAYSTTGTLHYLEAWNTVTNTPVISFIMPWHYHASNVRVSSTGKYLVAEIGKGLLKLSLTGDSLAQFHGHAAAAGDFGFTNNDNEVYVAYGTNPQMESYLKNGGKMIQQDNPAMRAGFERIVEDEAKSKNKTLTKAEKEKLVNEKMETTAAAFSSGSYRGYSLTWNLKTGGAYPGQAGTYSAQYRTVSTDKNYELDNEKFESAQKETGKSVAGQLDFLKNSEYFNKDSLEKSIKELQKAGAIQYTPEDALKDPYGSASQFLDKLKSTVTLENFNGPVTLLINKKTINKDTISLIKIDSTDWIMLLKNGFYMTSQKGAKSLSYTRGLDVLPFEQFDIQYNRPDLVLKAIGKADPSLVEAYRNAYRKRIKKLDIDTLQFKNDFNIPEADFSNREKIDFDQKTGKLTLLITANDNKNKLDRFNIWVNEVPVFGKNGKSIKDAKSNKLNTTVEIALSQGTNRIETSVMNANGVESYHVPLFVKYSPDKPIKEKTYFIGIGIDQFADNKYNLQYSAKDIRDLSKKLKEKYGNDIVIDTLFNQNVTAANVKALKQKLNQTTENDKVIVAYSGHGMLSKDFDYYLSTYSINFEQPEQNGLPYDDLEDLLDNIPARKKLMLIDACHSGEVDKEDLVTLNASPAGLIKGIKPVAYKKEGQFGLKNSFELMQSLFVNVGKSTGATIISAAAGTQFALEKDNLKNGVFTFSILKAMNIYPTMKVSDLKKIVGKFVEQETNGVQKPTSRNETIAVDWNVW